MKDPRGWSEEAIARLRERWLTPNHIGDVNEMIPRNPFALPIQDEEGDGPYDES